MGNNGYEEFEKNGRIGEFVIDDKIVD